MEATPRRVRGSSLEHVCFKLESNKGNMDPKLKELESSSAGTGLETPGQQCLPNDGTWETGRTTTGGFLTAGVGSNQGGNISSPTEQVGTRAGIAATPAKRMHKTTSQKNKQFDPSGKGEKALLWNAAVTLFFLGKALGHGRLVACASWFLSVLCVCLFALFSKLLFFSGDHFSAS